MGINPWSPLIFRGHRSEKNPGKGDKVVIEKEENEQNRDMKEVFPGGESVWNAAGQWSGRRQNWPLARDVGTIGAW